MMKLDNSKRMDALKGFLKDEKKKKKEKASSRSRSSGSKSYSTISSAASSASSKGSDSSPNAKMRRAPSGRRLGRCSSFEEPIVESSMEFVSPKNALQLQQSWESIRTSTEDYELRVGEELFMSMMEINPAIRQKTGISSLRSPEFDALCKRITGHVDFLVGMSGPSQSQEFTTLSIEDEIKKDGINPALLADAVPEAMKQIIGEDKYTAEVADAWSFFFVKLIHRMTKDD
jgi:hypothetical protein